MSDDEYPDFKCPRCNQTTPHPLQTNPLSQTIKTKTDVGSDGGILTRSLPNICAQCAQELIKELEGMNE